MGLKEYVFILLFFVFVIATLGLLGWCDPFGLHSEPNKAKQDLAKLIFGVWIIACVSGHMLSQIPKSRIYETVDSGVVVQKIVSPASDNIFRYKPLEYILVIEYSYELNGHTYTARKEFVVDEAEYLSLECGDWYKVGK